MINVLYSSVGCLFLLNVSADKICDLYIYIYYIYIYMNMTYYCLFILSTHVYYIIIVCFLYHFNVLCISYIPREGSLFWRINYCHCHLVPKKGSRLK